MSEEKEVEYDPFGSDPVLENQAHTVNLISSMRSLGEQPTVGKRLLSDVLYHKLDEKNTKETHTDTMEKSDRMNFRKSTF